ncbi:dUTP diphosphatase [Paenibacillus sp. FSL M7-1455]|uniref:dUTP diphosphatase n=1 Tax=Paenibacillus sp. FSL M7-1455 TaxID=2975316 RepID=UPI0030F904A1
MNEIPVKIKRLHQDAIIPKYAKPGDSGFDLVAVEDVIIAPGETALVPTGLAVEIPAGYELQVRPRSGISLRTKLRVANSPGTVDAGFRGEVKVIVDNIRRVDSVGHIYSRIDGTDRASTCVDAPPRGSYVILKGDRIAQAVITPVARANFEVVDELTETERGADGFGSSGVNAE